jgi:hypothetical protein
MPARRRSRSLTAIQPAPPVQPTPTADTRLDDLLLPTAGPNAVPTEKLTPRERMNEIVAILARGFLRKAAGIPPFAKPGLGGSASLADPPPGRAM